MLPIVPLHRSYLRTCNKCAYTWTVDRAVAGKRFGVGSIRKTPREANLGSGMMMWQGDGFLHDPAAQCNTDGESMEPVRAAMATCAHCGQSDFDQRPAGKASSHP